MITLHKTKQCSCGKNHDLVKSSDSLGYQAELLWFNCSCGSTLVVPEGETTDEGADSDRLVA